MDVHQCSPLLRLKGLFPFILRFLFVICGRTVKSMILIPAEIISVVYNINYGAKKEFKKVIPRTPTCSKFIPFFKKVILRTPTCSKFIPFFNKVTNWVPTCRKFIQFFEKVTFQTILFAPSTDDNPIMLKLMIFIKPSTA
jgi:hypothetical protein